MWAQTLQHTGLVALWHVGIFPDQGSNQYALYCKAESEALDHQGSPILAFLRPDTSKILKNEMHCIWLHVSLLFSVDLL